MQMHKFMTVLFGGLVVVGLAGCEVDVEDTGEPPTMDVEPGEAPDVDVRGPDVDVESERKRVTVPDVDVQTEEKEVNVPDVSVDFPDDEES